MFREGSMGWNVHRVPDVTENYCTGQAAGSSVRLQVSREFHFMSYGLFYSHWLRILFINFVFKQF